MDLAAIVEQHRLWLRSSSGGEQADLHGADLQGVDLQWVNLQGANLRGVDLQGANLRGADLRGADLQCADLQGADLRLANLRGANLRGADLRGAALHGANLEGTGCALLVGVAPWPIVFQPDRITVGCHVTAPDVWRYLTAYEASTLGDSGDRYLRTYRDLIMAMYDAVQADMKHPKEEVKV